MSTVPMQLSLCALCLQIILKACALIRGCDVITCMYVVIWGEAFDISDSSSCDYTWSCFAQLIQLRTLYYVLIRNFVKLTWIFSREGCLYEVDLSKDHKPAYISIAMLSQWRNLKMSYYNIHRDHVRISHLSFFRQIQTSPSYSHHPVAPCVWFTVIVLGEQQIMDGLLCHFLSCCTTYCAFGTFECGWFFSRDKPKRCPNSLFVANQVFSWTNK